MCELMKQQETHLKQQVRLCSLPRAFVVPTLSPILWGGKWNPHSRTTLTPV